MIGKALLLVTSAACLSGCVAAAIPVLAGGSMLRSDAISGDGNPKQASQSASTREPAPAPAGAPGVVVTELAALPAPSESDIRSGTRRRLEARSFDEFYGYALSQASTDPLIEPMRSAMLANPGSLEAVREDCGPLPPAVLVDLDPQGGVFDADSSTAGNKALAEVVAVLRSQGLTIAWISALPAEEEASVRARLAAFGLDPEGTDRLLLADTPDTTKQMMRRSFADFACPIAIAGDAREDFDELFAYLKNPEAAVGLNELFGAGWFLTPNPID